jgi:hypothetical protein
LIDHIPKLLADGFKKMYPIKFIVSLRDPVNRTLSSWRFKAHESYVTQEKAISKGSEDPLEVAQLSDSLDWGMKQGDCLRECYDKKKSMVGCSISKCRQQYDLMCKETKTFAEIQEKGKSAFCCRTAYYAHVAKSLYAYQFSKWFSYFDRSQFFIFTIEEFSRNRIGVLERLLDFLGLPLIHQSIGKYGYLNEEVLKKTLSFVINRTPRKKIFEDQVSLYCTNMK